VVRQAVRDVRLVSGLGPHEPRGRACSQVPPIRARVHQRDSRTGSVPSAVQQDMPATRLNECTQCQTQLLAWSYRGANCIACAAACLGPALQGMCTLMQGRGAPWLRRPSGGRRACSASSIRFSAK